MKKLFLALVFMGLLFLLNGQLVKAEDKLQEQAATTEANEVVNPVPFPNEEESSSKKSEVNVGNKICPVSGEKIDEKFKATYEYQGKVYNFCCPMCIDEFKKDPEKYIKKVEEELGTVKKEEMITEEQPTMPETEMPMEGGHHHE